MLPVRLSPLDVSDQITDNNDRAYPGLKAPGGS